MHLILKLIVCLKYWDCLIVLWQARRLDSWSLAMARAIQSREASLSGFITVRFIIIITFLDQPSCFCPIIFFWRFRITTRYAVNGSRPVRASPEGGGKQICDRNHLYFDVRKWMIPFTCHSLDCGMGFVASEIILSNLCINNFLCMLKVLRIFENIGKPCRTLLPLVTYKCD